MPASSTTDAAALAWRHERKFLVDSLTTPEVEALVRLHPAMFSPIHSRRYINNVYFDTEDGRALRDGLEGAGDRVKMRIRWYGDLVGTHDATLEFKIKRGLVGRKESVAIGQVEVTHGMSREQLQGILGGVVADLPAALAELLVTSRPVLVNRYRRSYFRSGDGRFRLTLDDEQQFFPFAGGSTALRHGSRDRRSSIVELKYAAEHDGDAHRIASRFPFRLTKSSKFVSGLARLTF